MASPTGSSPLPRSSFTIIFEHTRIAPYKGKAPAFTNKRNHDEIDGDDDDDEEEEEDDDDVEASF